jgi:Histidine-specific methyltransferase, SAM-dependent
VTAAFNRNLLVRINRELDADFDLNGFAHRAVWNAPESRVEMHLVIASRSHVRFARSSGRPPHHAARTTTAPGLQYDANDSRPRP